MKLNGVEKTVWGQQGEPKTGPGEVKQQSNAPILKKKEGLAGDATSQNRKGSAVTMDSDYGQRGVKHVTSNRATFKTAGRDLGFLNNNSPSLSH